MHLPDHECTAVAVLANERQAFWDILAKVLKNTLDGSSGFNELKIVDGSSRNSKISSLLERYYKTAETNKKHAKIVRNSLYKITEKHRY